MRTFSSIDDSYRRRPFTLVELLAAMAIFTVMLGMVFAMLAGAQRAWSAVDRNTRIYENARILMDLITRDLQSAVASGESGEEIPFYTGDSSTVDGTRIGFVAAVPEKNDLCQSALSEIQYRHYTGTSPSEPRWIFRRSQIGDHNDTSGSTSDYPNHAWDFYGDASSSPNWLDATRTVGGDTDNATDFQHVVAGVDSFSITCYDSGSAWGNNLFKTKIPSVVRVSFTLFDPNAMDVSDSTRQKQLIRESKRSFNKIIFLRTE